MVPGSLGWGSAVFAAMTTFAPSRAARRPMARPMPREPPVMKTVLPRRVMRSTRQRQFAVVEKTRAAHDTLLEASRADYDVLGKETAQRNPSCMSRIRVAARDERGSGERHVGKRSATLRQGEQTQIRRRTGECLSGRIARRGIQTIARCAIEALDRLPQ